MDTDVIIEEIKKLPPDKMEEVAALVRRMNGGTPDSDQADWLKAQEQSFQKVWDNPEDAVYDAL